MNMRAQPFTHNWNAYEPTVDKSITPVKRSDHASALLYAAPFASTIPAGIPAPQFTAVDANVACDVGGPVKFQFGHNVAATPEIPSS